MSLYMAAADALAASYTMFGVYATFLFDQWRSPRSLSASMWNSIGLIRGRESTWKRCREWWLQCYSAAPKCFLKGKYLEKLGCKRLTGGS